MCRMLFNRPPLFAEVATVTEKEKEDLLNGTYSCGGDPIYHTHAAAIS